MIMCSMLPQSTFKIWGITDQKIEHFYQFEYKASHRDWKLDSEFIYELNRLICEFHGITSFKLVLRNTEIDISNGLFDQQIFNRIHNFPGVSLTETRSVISYTSNSNNLANLSDLRFGIEGLRHLYRNFRFYRKIHPDTVYSIIYKWNNYMQNRRDLFWENKYIYSEILKLKAIEFINFYIDVFPEIHLMRQQNKTLIINPSINQTFDDLNDWIKKHQEFFSQWDNSVIFIKPHRISHFIYPKKFKIKKNYFETISDSLTSILPIEIMIFAVDNVRVLSAASSIIALNENIILKTPLSSEEKKEYLLMIKQIKKRSNISSIN